MTAALPLDPAACAALVASARWAAKVDASGGPDSCWLWTGSLTGNGYGQAWLAGRPVKAHRVALVAALGRDLAPGLQVDHACHTASVSASQCVSSRVRPCRHRRCANPAHLRELDARSNTLAGGTVTALNAARTHCPAGHSLQDPANLRPDALRRDQRGCLTCSRAQRRERAAAVGAAHAALGLTRREYVALFGYSRATAEWVLAELVAGRVPAPPAAGVA